MLNVLMPSLSRFRLTGGPNTILGIAQRLAARGVPVRYVSMSADAPEDERWFWGHLKALTGMSGADASIGEPDPDGVYLATTWQTAYYAQNTLQGRFIYFIQDYEPMFCRTPAEADMARETYGMDFLPIVNEGVLADHMAGVLDDPAVFEPAVDSEMFYPETKRRQLVFYARPNRTRNLYGVALEALRNVAESGLLDGWDVVSVGAKIGPVELAPGVVMRNVFWRNLSTYAAMMRGAYITLCPQLSPHTGYSVLETSACGGVAVTTVYETKTRARILEYAPRSIPVDPSVDGIAEGLKRAIQGECSCAPCRGLAAESWDEAFAPILPRVEEMYHELSRTPVSVRGGRM